MREKSTQGLHPSQGYQRLGRWIVLAVAAMACVQPGLSQQVPRVGFRRVTMAQYEENVYLRGGALEKREGAKPAVMAWGSQVYSIGIPKGRIQPVAPETRDLGAGGCLMEVNGDGKLDIIVNERGTEEKAGRMLWLESPDGKPHLIDTEASFQDCLPTNLNDKWGVLVIHRQSQLRFYELPETPADAEKWEYRDVYSIYTPSAQGGLLRGDVDGDGNSDILAGNYWLQAPRKPSKPWHLFAINKWWEGPRSAMLRLALVKPADAAMPALVAAEAEGSPARVAIFQAPDDPKQLWSPIDIEALPPIRKPEALATADLNGDQRPEIVIGENAGDGSRLLVYWDLGQGKYQGTRIDLTAGLIAIWIHDYDGDGDNDIIGLGPREFYVWRNQQLAGKQ